jgi:hypothetical protein
MQVVVLEPVGAAGHESEIVADKIQYGPLLGKLDAARAICSFIIEATPGQSIITGMIGATLTTIF